MKARAILYEVIDIEKKRLVAITVNPHHACMFWEDYKDRGGKAIIEIKGRDVTMDVLRSLK